MELFNSWAISLQHVSCHFMALSIISHDLLQQRQRQLCFVMTGEGRYHYDATLLKNNDSNAIPFLFFLSNDITVNKSSQPHTEM